MPAFLFPTTVTTIDDVPEQYRAFYAETEDDGGFKLTGDLADKIAAKDKVIERERARAAELEKNVKKIKAKTGAADVDAAAAKYDSILSELDQARKDLDDERGKQGKGDNKEAQERYRAEAAAERKKLAEEKDAELKAERERREKVQARLDRQMLENDARAAIAANRGKDKPLMAIVRQQLAVQEIDGDYVTVVLDDKGEPMRDHAQGGELMTPTAYVATLRKDADYADLFLADPASGSGARPPAGKTGGSTHAGNPFIPGKHFNRTEQMRLKKTDPKKFDRLQAEAEAAASRS
jgi:hypothetical protein